MTDDVAVAPTVAATVSSVPAARGAELPPGTWVGRYELLEKIGAGGMGVVYRARDPKLDRDVAVKLVGRVDADAAQQRLEREAQAMAKLSHPHVATVHDIGTHDGQLFIAMELCPGGSLAKWLRNQPPWREVVRRFIAAGRGLAAAHQLGLVHRDFKPDNVLVGQDAAIKVSDFGLVTSSTQPLASGTGSIEGTPAYMAPEQLTGGEVDARADQFSFAVSVWEGVCGGRPFQPEPGADDVLDGMLRAIRARRRMRSAIVDAPARVLRVLERALEADPAARWPSMTALLDALERAARPRWPRWAAAAAVTALAGAAWAMIALRRPELTAFPIADVQRATGKLIAAGAETLWHARYLDLGGTDMVYRIAHRVSGDPVYLLIDGMILEQHDDCRATDAFLDFGRTTKNPRFDQLLARYAAMCDRWRARVETLPDSVDELEMVADEAWRSGDFQRAHKMISHALDLSQDARFLKRLGDLEVDEGDCVAARQSYDQYIAAEPRLSAQLRKAIEDTAISCVEQPRR